MTDRRSLGDLGLAPWDLQREASRARLDVIAITNHGGLSGGRLNRWWAGLSESGPLVIAGQEVTALTYHLIAAGIERPIDPRQPAVDAIRAVQSQGGVAIAAHPIRGYQTYDDDAVMALDGVEAAHPVAYDSEESAGDIGAFYRRAAAVRPGVAAIGSSDFHIVAPLGIVRTILFAREYTEAGVLDAIRRGQTVAADRDGNLYGAPSLVARARAHFDRHPDQGLRRPERTSTSRAAVLLALAGLLGLTLTDARRPAP